MVCFYSPNQVMKLCGKMVEAGQAYSAANQLFLSSLTQLSVFQEKRSVISVRTLVSLTFLLAGTLISSHANANLAKSGFFVFMSELGERSSRPDLPFSLSAA